MSEIKVLAGLNAFEEVRKNLVQASPLAAAALPAISGGPWLVKVSPDFCLYLHRVFSQCACLPPHFPFA